MKNTTSITLRILPVALCLLFTLLANKARGQVPYYWDINGNTAGAGGPTPNGDWDDMSAGGFWTIDATGMTATGAWVDGNTPVFSALNGTGATTTDATGTYTITVGTTTHTIAGMQTAPGSGPVTVSGAGSLQIASGMQTFTATNLTISVPLVDPTGGGSGGYQDTLGNNVSLYGVNTFSGNVNLNGGQTHIQASSGLGSSANLITMASGFSALWIDGTSLGSGITLANNFVNDTLNAGINFVTAANTPLTLNGNFDLGATLQLRNAGPLAGAVTINGTISGNGDLILSGNGGGNDSTTILNGPNTYTGKTIIGQGGAARGIAVINSIQNVNSGIANSLGNPPDATTGQIDIGHSGFADALKYNSSSDSSTDRIINNVNTPTGGMWLFSDGAGAITYSGNITAVSSASARTLVIQGASTAANTISGPITDGNGGGVINLTKDGTGTWAITGNNTFSGALTVQGGGTLYIGGVQTFPGNISVGAASAGTLKLSAANALPSGTGKGTLTVNTGSTFDLNGYDCTINNFGTSAGTIDCSTGTGTLTVGVLGSVNANKLPTGVIQNSGSGVLSLTLAQTADAGNVAAGTANTYTGSTTVQSAVLQISADGASPGAASCLGAVPNGFVANNIILDHNNGLGVGVNGVRGYLRAGANVTLHANRGIYLGNTGGTGAGGCIQAKNGNTIQVNGVISGPGSFWAGPAASVAGGICNLNAVNTYQGGTYCGSGSLQTMVAGAIPTGSPLTMGASHTGVNGTFFNMLGTSQTIGSLASTTGFGVGTPLTDIPQLQLSGSGTLTIIQTANTTFNGAIRQGSSSGGNVVLDATSTGTLTLGQANDYNGSTTINAGTLEINKASGIASSPTVTVANGGFLKLNFNTALKTTATLNLAGSPAAGTVILNLSGGTQTITALNFGGTSMPHGTWGAPSSGALHEHAAFTGSGFLNVTSGGPAPVATSVSGISGTTLSYDLGAGSLFVLLGTNDVTAPMSLWTRLATNGSTPGSFTIPAVGSQPQMFYRVISE